MSKHPHLGHPSRPPRSNSALPRSVTSPAASSVSVQSFFASPHVLASSSGVPSSDLARSSNGRSEAQSSDRTSAASSRRKSHQLRLSQRSAGVASPSLARSIPPPIPSTIPASLVKSSRISLPSPVPSANSSKRLDVKNDSLAPSALTSSRKITNPLGAAQSASSPTTAHQSHHPSPLQRQTDVKIASPTISLQAHRESPSASSESIQTYDDETELVTEVPEQADLDDEMKNALSTVIDAHSNQLSKLRRLLSSADHGSSMTMHLLHGQIKTLEEQSNSDSAVIDDLRRQNSSLKAQVERHKALSYLQADASGDKRSIVDVLSNTSSKDYTQDLKRCFRKMTPAARLHLLHLLLELALPGDLSALIQYLTQVERTKRDFITLLPEHLSIRCLLFIGDVRSILNCRLVSRQWNEMISRSGKELWKTLSLSLTSMDDEPPRPRKDDCQGWFELYQGLHYREENWRLGLAQRVVVLKGHSGSIGALKLRGTTLVTGSLDGTLRIWNVRATNAHQQNQALVRTVKMPAPVSSLDFSGQFSSHSGVIAAGGNDIGRVFLISMGGAILSTLSGHNKGIRTLAMNSEYLVSGGYDKALVVWDWKQSTRIVKFGQQTHPCAAISLFGSCFSSVQVDGVIRCFNILTRECVSQHKVQAPPSSSSSRTSESKIGGEVFQWFVAAARRVIIATKTTIFQLEYHLSEMDGYTVDLTKPPKLISTTPIIHELNSGTLDVLKRRFAAAPRFATRLGDDMRIFIGHLPENEHDRGDDNDDGYREEDRQKDSLQPIGGAWLDAESSVSSRNPTVMSLSSDQLVVGCSDGLLYALDFCGRSYKRQTN